MKKFTGICLAVLMSMASLQNVSAKGRFATLSVQKNTEIAIEYCQENQIMSGYENGDFGEQDPITRGQIATILWRLQDCPEVQEPGFVDVPSVSFYAKASQWAKQTGIFSGNLHENGSTSFDGENRISRQDLMTVFYRYAVEIDHKEPQLSQLDSYGDADQVSRWAKSPMQWAVHDNLIQFANGKLEPELYSNRAETAVLIQRYLAPGYTGKESIEDSSVEAFARAVIAQTGTDLKDLFDWTVDHIQYKSDVLDRSTEEYARIGFLEGKGNCHAFASVFYYLAKEAGYDIRILNNEIRRSDGGTQNHGWTLVKKGDKEYICDPEGEYTQGNKANFYMVDPLKPPVRYLYPEGEEPLGGYAKY